MHRGGLAPGEGGKKRGRGREVSGKERERERYEGRGTARGCCESEGVDGRISCLGAMFLLRGTEGDTEKGGGGWGGGRKRRRVEGGGVGGGSGDDDDGGGGAHRWKASTHSQGGCSEAEGEKVETMGAKFFRGRSCNVPHRLATLAFRRGLLCCCSFHSFPSRCLGPSPSLSLEGAIILY